MNSFYKVSTLWIEKFNKIVIWDKIYAKRAPFIGARIERVVIKLITYHHVIYMI